MNISRIFILRPIATSLLMAALLLSGLLAYRYLPIAALPQIDYPTMQVQTFYPGASPDVMAAVVTAPLERQFGTMSGLVQMSSQSSAGASVITLQFDLSVPLDVAEQEVQAAINAADSLLPRDLPNPPVYSKVNPADPPIMTLAVVSDAMPLTRLEDLVDTRLAQKISQLPGVGLVTLSGGQRPAVRIQVNPKALASAGLTLADVRTAVDNANVNDSKGSFDGKERASTIDANDQLASAEEYARVIIGYKNGAPLRLHYVAGRGQEFRPAIILSVQRQPGANVIEVADSVNELVPRIRQTLPGNVEIITVTDRTVTIRATVHDVQLELALAIVLVIAVIWLFLRNVQATIIPALAVPLSLVGSLGVMYLAGYSLNNLTLMALVIASGFVVDDAIVVIENISRYLEEGMKPLQAALQGAGQIGFTIISLTLSLVAVLIPLLFMGDVSGRLFREFAVTLAVTILISAAISLSLTPMLCAVMLGREHGRQQEHGAFFDCLLRWYARALDWVLARQGLVLAVAVGTLLLTVALYIVTPKGFFPTQDTGVLQFWVKCGASFPLIGELEGLLKEAVMISTVEAPLRHNSVETFDEYNTGKNVGKGTPTVFWDIVPDSDQCEIYAYMAGGGCTLPGKAMVLMPGAGYEGVTRFVLDVMTSYGLNACPPLLVGVGVATSVETAALLSKKALMRPLGSHNENQRAAAMEKLLEDGINSIGLGPQGMGGKYSVMGVHIENTARHPSTIGVAVNVGCWSHRRGHIIFDKDLNYTITTHSGVTL